MSDAVNKPAHYNQGSIECIDAMQQILTPEEFRGFLKGNVLKYLWREKGKNGIDDLRKGKDYYDRLIQSFDESEDQPVIKQSSTTEPDPGEGYQLLSKDTTEDLQPGDEWWHHSEQRWRDVFPTCTTVPCPNTWYRRKVRSLQNQTDPPEGWRWLEVGEVIRRGDRFWYEGAWHDRHEDLIGCKYSVHHCQTIRRNKFEVGEKVVVVSTGEVFTLLPSLKEGMFGVDDRAMPCHYRPEELAPYIEEAK